MTPFTLNIYASNLSTITELPLHLPPFHFAFLRVYFTSRPLHLNFNFLHFRFSSLCKIRLSWKFVWRSLLRLCAYHLPLTHSTCRPLHFTHHRRPLPLLDDLYSRLLPSTFRLSTDPLHLSIDTLNHIVLRHFTCCLPLLPSSIVSQLDLDLEDVETR